MSGHLKAIKLTDRVFWVGAIDWGLRDFHGYLTQRGTTYNAYLVMSDEPILIDTVKAPFKEELISRISSVIDLSKIEYIISNHAEMDHSGSLPEMIELIKPKKVFASVKGVEALKEHFHLDREIFPVKDGETIRIGNLNFTFLETRMLHWPDSMFSYLSDEQILFSSDAFGMHLAHSRRFADEIDFSIIEYEGAKYFANILLPYSPLVLKLIEKVSKLGIQIKIIAPDHGPIWRKEVNKIIELYSKWATQKPTKKAVIVYDTMWESTAKMARAICDGLITSDIEVRLMPLKSFHRSDVAKELLEAGAIIIGSPTLNNGIFPSVSDLLTYVKGLRSRVPVSACFGSYGWSGEAVHQIKEILSSMKIEVLAELKAKYVPDENILQQCFALGKMVAQRIKDIT